MTSPIKTSSIQPDSKRIEHVGDYIIQNRIGQGSFATVYKAQHKVKKKKNHYRVSLVLYLHVFVIGYPANCRHKMCKAFKTHQKAVGKP
jgi:serine/threonine protein kinase